MSDTPRPLNGDELLAAAIPKPRVKKPRRQVDLTETNYRALSEFKKAHFDELNVTLSVVVNYVIGCGIPEAKRRFQENKKAQPA